METDAKTAAAMPAPHTFPLDTDDDGNSDTPTLAAAKSRIREADPFGAFNEESGLAQTLARKLGKNAVNFRRWITKRYQLSIVLRRLQAKFGVTDAAKVDRDELLAFALALHAEQIVSQKALSKALKLPTLHKHIAGKYTGTRAGPKPFASDAEKEVVVAAIKMRSATSEPMLERDIPLALATAANKTTLPSDKIVRAFVNVRITKTHNSQPSVCRCHDSAAHAPTSSRTHKHARTLTHTRTHNRRTRQNSGLGATMRSLRQRATSPTTPSF